MYGAESTDTQLNCEKEFMLYCYNNELYILLSNYDLLKVCQHTKILWLQIDSGLLLLLLCFMVFIHVLLDASFFFFSAFLCNLNLYLTVNEKIVKKL